MSIKYCKEFIECIKSDVQNIQMYANREEYEEIPRLVESIYDEIDCLEVAVEDISNKMDEITLTVERMEG